MRKLSDNSALDLAELKVRLRSAPDSALLKPLGIEAVALGSNALDRLPERFHEYSTRIRNIFKSKGVLAMD